MVARAATAQGRCDGFAAEQEVQPLPGRSTEDVG